MPTHGRAWMKWAACLTLTLVGNGCASVTSNSAVCDGSRADRTAHAAALVADGGPQSLVTGQRLISRLDAGCAL